MCHVSAIPASTPLLLSPDGILVPRFHPVVNNSSGNKEDGITVVVPLAQTVSPGEGGTRESKEEPRSRRSLERVVPSQPGGSASVGGGGERGADAVLNVDMPILNTPYGNFVDGAKVRGSNGQGSLLHVSPLDGGQLGGAFQRPGPGPGAAGV